ncbi:MAG TPA: cytochrome c oxidase subunit 3 [Acidimicrobiales bacterium]
MSTVSTTTSDVEILSTAPPAPPPRPRVLLVGTALASSAAVMTVLALIALYLRLRADVLAEGGTWLPEEANLQLTPGNMGMVTLAMAAVTAQWAVYALRNEDRPNAYLALGVTVLLGVAFINGAVYGWQQLGLGIADSTQAVLIYTITGLHVAMVAVGLLYLSVMAFKALGGQLTGRAAEGLSAAALFWYVTIGVYAVIWYGIYITK